MAQVLRGKCAVVTGGSRGIGRAVVERLARDGASVVFGYRRETEAAADVVRVVGEAGGSAHAVRVDLDEAGAAERFMAEAQEHLGALDVLVNNAAPAAASGGTPLAETGEADFARMMAVLATAPFLTMRWAARHMRDGGRIVNVSTLNTVRPVPGIAPYAAGKGALEQLTAVGAVELGPRGITVNTVSPGATDTDLLRGANPPEAAAAQTPLRRLGETSDVADVVAFLAGPDGRWLTGQNLRATGGLA